MGLTGCTGAPGLANAWFNAFVILYWVAQITHLVLSMENFLLADGLLNSLIIIIDCLSF
jgi:hypothetical protein